MMTKYIFEETQIGSHITTNFICIDRTDSVKEAMNQLLVQARNHDNIETLYIIEPDGTYYGILELKKLLAAKKEDSLETLIVRDYPYLYADEETEDCASELKEYEEDSIPVLDRDKHIVGVITASETANIIDDELGDDYAKLAGLCAGPLGEDHDARTVFALVGQLLHRGGVTAAALDGNRAHAAQEPACQRILKQLLLGQNTQPFPVKHRNSDKNRVQIGDVVGCDDIGASIADGPQILAADDLKPPEDMCQHPDDGQQNPIQKHKQPPQICARIVRFSRSKLSCRPMSLVSTKMASSACFRGATARWLS